MRILIPLAALALSACGVGGSTALKDLSDEQATKVCEEYDPKTITCGEGDFTFTFEFATDCDTVGTGDIPEACEATVGDYRDCLDAIYALSDEEFCSSEDLPADCDALFSDACME